MLSVVIPVYNAEKYLPQCIESVLNQSMCDIEVILVNDGSVDKSLEMCIEYQKKDNRVKIINSDHKGTYDARKLGALSANGEYITFVDSDDFISEESFILAMDDIKSSVDVISFAIYRYFDNNDVRYDCDEFEEKLYTKQEIERLFFPIMIWNENKNRFGIDPSLCNKIYKSKIIKRIYSSDYNVNFHYGEDMSIVYPIMINISNFSIHHQAYYYHRQRPKNIIPSYFLDEEYPLKLNNLYTFLSHQMNSNHIFQRQIDLFYAYSAQLIKLKYGLSIEPVDKIFPFDRVNPNDKIVIYGAGNVGKLFVRQNKLLDYCQIILWVDQNYSNFSGIKSPEDILNVCYDKIVIAIADDNVKTNVKKFLIKLGIDENLIV